MFEPGLYVVATPIGNLGDATRRMIDILGEADLVLAEDTRSTGLLAQHLGITIKKYGSYTDGAGSFKMKERAKQAVEIIQKGGVVALVSDAGTPGISDPGDMLVAEVRAAGCKVYPVPGASALTAALSVAGLGIQRPLFYGFLPHKKGRQTAVKKFHELLEDNFVDGIVLFESPHRVGKLMTELWPECQVMVAREITKKFEEIRSGSPAELADWASTIKGEVVVILTRKA